MPHQTITFYRYVPIAYPEGMKDYLRILCQDLSLVGRILIATEGINAAISGEEQNLNEFKRIIGGNPLFSDLTFREQKTKKRAHHKLVVRVREEIVVFGTKVDLNNKGKYFPPAILQQWYDHKEDFIIVDVRNDYEHTIGKFKHGITLPLKNFREFHEHLPTLNKYKTKRVVLYCTGGIRCEKASAYLNEHGFSDVYQLEGGIINYINQFPNAYWEGGLFVFNDQLVEEVGEPVTTCQFCDEKEEQYANCHNLDCDKLFIACNSCLEEMKNTCSEECKQSPRQRVKI